MFLGIPNNSEKVHRRNSVLSNIRSRSNYTGRNKPLQCPGFRIQPHQEFRINAKTIELVERASRIGNCMASKISTKTCSEIQ